MKLCNWIKDHLLISAVLYLMIYLVGWGCLELFQFREYYIIHCKLDDLIPFQELFFLPYASWFLQFPGVYLWLWKYDQEECWRYFRMLAGGMTLFLLISVLFPNGQDMRPVIDGQKNFLTRVISLLWTADTPTNIFPSIHVYNAVVAQIAVFHSTAMKQYPKVQWALLILTVLICLSTVFLKQHSVLDGFGALVMAAGFYWPIYHQSRARAKKTDDFLQEI